MNAPVPKIVVIVGPTASGKTALSVALAERYSGEVISADSRQVYRGLDLGTGKVTREEMRGIPHHLLDVADPRDTYTAADFVHDADAAIASIVARDALPIVAGGTFFYIDALLGRVSLADIPANAQLRAELETETTEALYARLREKDPVYAEIVDQHNRHRLIRALEVIEARGAMPTPVPAERYDALIIGIDVPKDALNEKIDARLDERFAAGMLEEARMLHAGGLSYERMESLGLEYRYMARHLQDTLSYEDMQSELRHKSHQYAKRQRTWLRRMPNVQWYAPGDVDAVEAAVRQFLGTDA